MQDDWRLPAGALPRVHSPEQATASLAAVLARRVRSCTQLTLREVLRSHGPEYWRNEPTVEQQLDVWRAMMRVCAETRALHIHVGFLRRGYAQLGETRKLLDALPR